jgi:hypothetical protein
MFAERGFGAELRGQATDHIEKFLPTAGNLQIAHEPFGGLTSGIVQG